MRVYGHVSERDLDIFGALTKTREYRRVDRRKRGWESNTLGSETKGPSGPLERSF